MTLGATLRADWRANPANPKALIILTLFRLTHWFACRKQEAFALWLLGVPLLVFYRVAVEWILGVELPAKTVVGPGLNLHHGQGLVVNDHTTIGSHCILRHNTTIGCVMLPDGGQGPSPILGNGVEVGANVVILGGIRIGHHAVVGAGSVVVHDVPDYAVVVGNPARVVRHREAVATRDS